METRVLGKTGFKVSVLGFGGAEIGFEHSSSKIVTNLLSSALDSGLNVIDTGECYQESEGLIGRTVGHRRSEYYLFTKCGHADGFDKSTDWDPLVLQKSVDRSLLRLRTDYLDLLQLHTCSEGDLRRGDLIDVLERAREAGKTRCIGYSGDSLAAVYAVECGAFDALETSINIADQEAIDLTLYRAKEQGMGIIAKRPIANVVWMKNQRPTEPHLQRYWERLKQLNYAFIENDSWEAVSTSLRFTLGVPGVHTAIVGTTSSEHWHANLRHAGLGPLTNEQFEGIRDRWSAFAHPGWVGQN